MKRRNNPFTFFIAIICVIILAAAMCSCGNSGSGDSTEATEIPAATTMPTNYLDDGFGTEVGM